MKNVKLGIEAAGFLVSFPKTATAVLFPHPLCLPSSVGKEVQSKQNRSSTFNPTTRNHSVVLESCHLKWKSQQWKTEAQLAVVYSTM